MRRWPLLSPRRLSSGSWGERNGKPGASSSRGWRLCGGLAVGEPTRGQVVVLLKLVAVA